ncbi:hypothetical protein E4U54_000024 [Claviceps lovelessii]|nr:hypothetical protein E4U54_000024 [Claviceps lovelessii]
MYPAPISRSASTVLLAGQKSGSLPETTNRGCSNCHDRGWTGLEFVHHAPSAHLEPSIPTLGTPSCRRRRSHATPPGRPEAGAVSWDIMNFAHSAISSRKHQGLGFRNLKDFRPGTLRQAARIHLRLLTFVLRKH